MDDESLYFSKLDHTNSQSYSTKNDLRTTMMTQIDDSYNQLAIRANEDKVFKIFLGYIFKFKTQNQVFIIECVVKYNLDVKRYLEERIEEDTLVNELLTNKF